MEEGIRGPITRCILSVITSCDLRSVAIIVRQKTFEKLPSMVLFHAECLLFAKYRSIIYFYETSFTQF